MRAGFIPARPERKERNMAVPASKRARAIGEYVRQARIVLSETQHLMRRWPKSRERVETQHVMRIAYEAYTAAYAADVIYASTVEGAAAAVGTNLRGVRTDQRPRRTRGPLDRYRSHCAAKGVVFAP